MARPDECCEGTLRDHSPTNALSVVVVESALRDEGTSHHYLPPSRTVDADPLIVDTLADIAAATHVAYTVGRSLTTDALFGQTPERIMRRRMERYGLPGPLPIAIADGGRRPTAS